MNTGIQTRKGYFLLSGSCTRPFSFLNSRTCRKRTVVHTSLHSREGHLCCPWCFGLRRLEGADGDSSVLEKVSAPCARASERAWDRTFQLLLPDSAASLLIRSRPPGEPPVWWLFAPRASRIVDSTLLLPPQRGETPGFTSLQNSCSFLPLRSSRELFWAFPPRVFGTSKPLGWQEI